MKLTKQRNYRDNLALTRGIISKNPVLYYGFALPYIVMAGISLKTGIALSIAMAITVIPTMAVAAIFSQQIPKFAQIMVYTIVSMAFLQIAAIPIKYISPTIFDSMGIYFPLVVVNGIILTRTRLAAQNAKPVPAMLDGLIQSIGFTLVMCLVASIREIIAFNTIWGIPLDMSTKITGAMLPFFGFILVGFIIALGKFIDSMIKKLIYLGENPKEQGGVSK